MSTSPNVSHMAVIRRIALVLTPALPASSITNAAWAMLFDTPCCNACCCLTQFCMLGTSTVIRRRVTKPAAGTLRPPGGEATSKGQESYSRPPGPIGSGTGAVGVAGFGGRAPPRRCRTAGGGGGRGGLPCGLPGRRPGRGRRGGAAPGGAARRQAGGGGVRRLAARSACGAFPRTHLLRATPAKVAGDAVIVDRRRWAALFSALILAMRPGTIRSLLPEVLQVGSPPGVPGSCDSSKATRHAGRL